MEHRSLVGQDTCLWTCTHCASHFLCVTFLSPCLVRIPCDSPDNVCAMAQVIAKLSRQQHLPVFYGCSDVTLQIYFAMVGVFLKHWWNMAARSGKCSLFLRACLKTWEYLGFLRASFVMGTRKQLIFDEYGQLRMLTTESRR